MTYHPWAHAGRYIDDLLIARMRLPRGTSWYLPEEAAIVLDDRLTQAEARCRVAHEVIHYENGDEYLDDPLLDRRRELRVRELAARRLISDEALVRALLWTQDEAELAEELWCDKPTVVTRLRTLRSEEKDLLDRRFRELEEGAA